MPQVLTHVLMLWPFFGALTAQYLTEYRLIFFVFQLTLISGVTFYLSRRYGSAIWLPQPASWKRSLLSLCALLPLLIYHFYCGRWVIALWNFPDNAEAAQVLASVHQETWSRLAYGSSAQGVILSSLLSFTAPVWEEVVLTGFLLNRIAKWRGYFTGITGVALCFALGHSFQFGMGLHLVPLFFASATYAIIRVFSGSVLLAIFSHCVINAVIFLPKWIIAFTYFNNVFVEK